MIEFKCPRCGMLLVSPSSMAGRAEHCPGCDNVCPVPRPGIRTITRTIDALGRSTGRLAAFCRNRKKTVAVVVINFLLLTGLASWLLPSWLPRPMIRIETGQDAVATADSTRGKERLGRNESAAETSAHSRRGFGTREAMLARLANYGYRPATREPIDGVLRGRALQQTIVTIDASVPIENAISLWSPLEDCDRVVGFSTTLAAPGKTVEPVGLASRTRTHAIEIAATHRRQAQDVLAALFGLRLSDATAPLDNESAPGGGEPSTQTFLAVKGDFLMEVIRTYTGRARAEGPLVVIVRDESWDR